MKWVKKNHSFPQDVSDQIKHSLRPHGFLDALRDICLFENLTPGKVVFPFGLTDLKKYEIKFTDKELFFVYPDR